MLVHFHRTWLKLLRRNKTVQTSWAFFTSPLTMSQNTRGNIRSFPYWFNIIPDAITKHIPQCFISKGVHTSTSCRAFRAVYPIGLPYYISLLPSAQERARFESTSLSSAMLTEGWYILAEVSAVLFVYPRTKK